MGIRKSPEDKAQKVAARDERAFWASPIGQARRAYMDGDLYFQVEIAHSQVKGYIGPMSGVHATTKHAMGGTDAIGAIVSEGWRLHTASHVFTQTGQMGHNLFVKDSRGRVDIQGQVIGIYLFERIAK